MEKAKKNLYETICILYITIALPIIKRQTPDNDIYFLMATGREILEKGIPYLNPFHLAEDLEIIVQQWLGCILNYVVYTSAGNIGLTVLAVGYTIFHLWAVVALSSLFTKSRKTLVIILLITFIGMYQFFNIRGSIVTSALLIWEVYFLIRYTKETKFSYLIPLPLISLFVINWQMALWPFIPFIIFIFLLPGTAEDITAYYKAHKRDYQQLLGIFIASMAAGFINPYGIKGMTYLLNSLGIIDAYVKEFAAVNISSLTAIVALLQLMLLIIYCGQQKEKTNIKYVGLSIFGFLLSITILRNVWFYIFMIPTSILAMEQIWKNETIKDLLNLLLPSKKRGYSIIDCGLWIGIIAMILFTKSIPYSPASMEYNNSYVPKSAITYLESLDMDKKEIRLMTDFNNGGYFAWHGYSIYIDARPELYTLRMNKKEDIYKNYQKSNVNALTLSTEISKYKFTHIIVGKNTPMYFFLIERDDYKPVLSPKLDYQLFEQINTGVKNKPPKTPSQQDKPQTLPKDEFV